MDLGIPKFNTKKELFDFIVSNEEIIFAEKKSQLKKADGVYFAPVSLNNINAVKSAPTSLLDKDEIDVKVIINTTNIMDSHKDVHIPGLWDKSLSENTRIKHLQEHQMRFDKVISDKDDLNAYVENYTWKQLGFNAEGKTQALVFESKVKKSRNEYMHDQYAKDNVDNHSVGMRYVKLVTCINDEDYGAQFEAWEKYFPQIINPGEAEKSGYFWAVTEAKAIEGSAVVMGSNPITPTINVKEEVIVEPTLVEIKAMAIKSWLSK